MSNRQIWPWSTEWNKAKAKRVWPRECTGHSKHPLPIAQEKTLHMDITRWPTPKWCAFRGLECKSRKSEISGVTGKFDFGVQNEAGQRLTEFCQENALVLVNTLFQQHKRWLHMDITRWSIPKIRLIIFFAAEDREALYSQQRQDRELTMAQIMNSLLPNSDLYWRE